MEIDRSGESDLINHHRTQISCRSPYECLSIRSIDYGRHLTITKIDQVGAAMASEQPLGIGYLTELLTIDEQNLTWLNNAERVSDLIQTLLKNNDVKVRSSRA